MKKMSLLLMAVLTIARTFGQQTAKEVIVTGKVINATATTPQVFKFNFLNPFLDGTQSAKLDALNAFAVKEEVLFKHNMTIQYNGTFINLFVSPGDSVHLTIDGALLDKPDLGWLTVTGDNATINTQLSKAYIALSKVPNAKYDNSLPVSKMLEEVKKDYDVHIAALNDYAAKNTLDPILIDFFKRDFKYVISNWISDYVDGNKLSLSEQQERLQLFVDPFFDTYDDANFQSMMYPYHVSFYAMWKSKTDPAIALAMKENRGKDAIKAGVALLLKEPAGIARDYMVYKYISSFSNKTPAVLDSLPAAKGYFINAVYYEYLDKSGKLVNNVNFPKTVIAGVSYLTPQGDVQKLPEGDVFAYLTKKYPGKAIYIDVYATWCGPCLAEMKFAPAIHQSFNAKDVVFVNLCLQSAATNWKKLVKDANIAGENYFLDDDATKLFMGTYNVNGFPTYILVNKKGKITTVHAPRPSEKEVLKHAIKKLVEGI